MTEREYTAADCKAWRDGNWLMASLDGQLVAKRYTRDTTFTRAEFVWKENRSPAYPKTFSNFERVEFAGEWRSPRCNLVLNRFSVPIERN